MVRVRGRGGGVSNSPNAMFFGLRLKRGGGSEGVTGDEGEGAARGRVRQFIAIVLCHVFDHASVFF